MLQLFKGHQYVVFCSLYADVVKKGATFWPTL